MYAVYQRIEAPLLTGLIIITARMYNTVHFVVSSIRNAIGRCRGFTKNRSLILERFPS